MSDSSITKILSRVNDDQLLSNISLLQDFGTRRWDQPNRDSISGWVFSQFLKTGISDVRFDSFSYGSTLQRNIVATIPGVIHPQSVIIIGGHFDSQNPTNVTHAPGADDNASGTSGILEMARVLKSVNYQPAVTVKFIGFAAEEAGLRGSLHYAEEAQSLGEDIKVMLNFDMIGNRDLFREDRDFSIVAYSGCEAFSNLQKQMALQYTTLTPLLTPSYINQSDSWPFYLRGYDVTFSIEKDFSPYYHSVNDQVKYLDISYTREIVQAGLATFLTLDEIPHALLNFQVCDRGDGKTLVVDIDDIQPIDFSTYKVTFRKGEGIIDSVFSDSSKKIILSGLIAGSNYIVGISVVDLAGLESPMIEQICVPRIVPLEPSGLSAQASAGGVILSWRPNQELDLAGYNIYRKKSTDLNYSLIHYQQCPDTSWLDSILSGENVSYGISAVDSSRNESVMSDTVDILYVAGVDEHNVPSFEFQLLQNFPNPFNPLTSIRFELMKDEHIKLVIYDVAGREVETLTDGFKRAGTHSILWNSGEAPSGIYFYQLQTRTMKRTKKMILIR